MNKVLIIEDNEEVRENTAEILELSNYRVFTAGDGKAGVQMALKEKPDIIICDIMMPVLDGYGVLHLLSKHSETAGIPFIFLTAKSEKADFRKGMEMGADDYLSKPFDGIELLHAIETRLKKRKELEKRFNLNREGVNDFINQASQSAGIHLTSDEREVCEYKKKHILYKEGQRPKFIYFVIKGKIKTYKTSAEGKELITSVYSEGDFIGHTAVLEEMNYKDQAEVLEEATLMMIPREDFITLMTSDSQIAKQFIKIITNDIIEKEEQLLNLAYNSLRKKVAYGLSLLAAKFRQEGKKEIIIDLSRENLAQVIGVATESLIRTISDFKSEKLIDVHQSKIYIYDEKKLKNLMY